MIFWGFTWFFIIIIISVGFLQEYINGTNNVRFWVCLFLLFFLIISMIFVMGSYIQSKQFYKQFINYKNKIDEKAPLSLNQEISILGLVIKYNNILHSYQREIKTWRHLAPVYKPLKNLSLIQLENFDTANYLTN